MLSLAVLGIRVARVGLQPNAMADQLGKRLGIGSDWKRRCRLLRIVVDPCRSDAAFLKNACTPQSGAPKTWSQLEVELLSGQKLQGVGTSNEVQEVRLSSYANECTFACAARVGMRAWWDRMISWGVKIIH
eukprot:scaffold15966_cov17-Tisochrysis_lutea.AAC.1